MKRIVLFAVILALPLCAAFCACATAEPVSAYGLTFDSQDTVVDFDAAGVTIRDIAELEQLIAAMPQLQEVRMFNSKLSRSQTDYLFDTYPQIFFGWTIKLYTHTIRTDMTAFSTLHGHTGKEGDPFHDSRQLSVLRYCKKMLALDIGHNYLEDISFLAEMPQLKVLILGANYYMQSLDPLAGLTQLEYLEIFSCNARDATPLQNLVNLRDLNMTYNTKLADISCLYDLPNLERFWCGYTRLNDEQKAAMEAAHPDCEFDWVNNPTEGTWRLHPHYFTIYDIFHEFVYKPFDEAPDPTVSPDAV